MSAPLCTLGFASFALALHRVENRKCQGRGAKFEALKLNLEFLLWVAIPSAGSPDH